MKTRIRVTSADIRKGTPQSCRRCPIAQAVTRLTGLPTEVSDSIQVYNDWVVLDGGALTWTNANERFELPRSAKRFIARFDTGKPVKPFTFFI